MDHQKSHGWRGTGQFPLFSFVCRKKGFGMNTSIRFLSALIVVSLIAVAGSLYAQSGQGNGGLVTRMVTFQRPGAKKAGA